MSAGGVPNDANEARYFLNSAPGGRWRNRAMVTWGRNFAMLNGQPDVAECAANHLREGDNRDFRRCADPEHPGRSAWRKVPEPAQVHTEFRCPDIVQTGPYPVLRFVIHIADESQGQMQAIGIQPPGVRQPGLQLPNGRFQRIGQLNCDEQAWHCGSPTIDTPVNRAHLRAGRRRPNLHRGRRRDAAHWTVRRLRARRMR